MKKLTTKRLILRAFEKDDLAAVHSYSCRAENILYVDIEPNSEEQAQAFIDRAIQKSFESPVTNYYYAVTLKDCGMVIGCGQLKVISREASVGWILHRDYWKRGYGTEVAEALLRFGFDELNLHRITAECDAKNHGSYRIMEKIGMRREGLFIASRPANKVTDQPYSDGLLYAMLKEEWEAQKEMARYIALPCLFEGFIDLPMLSDGVVHLVCTAKQPAIPEKKYVPAYIFAVCLGGEKIGEISLRIGYSGGLREGGLYYGGQIGYGIDKKHRGRGYAVRACRLLQSVAKAHGMHTLLITNAHDNHASKRVCEKLGARLTRVARLPEWHELYQEGHRFVNIFEWSL